MRYMMRYAVMVLGATALLLGCAEQRDTRTELYNENTYLSKDFLTRANPNQSKKDDFGWLMGVSVARVSVPTVISDIFPGLQSELKYVRFGFTQSTLQLIDGIVPGPYGDEANLGDPRKAQNLAPRVLQEYEGTHVDIQLRRNLDGEVTNFTEENRERDWQKRQHFKVNLEKGAFSDLSKVSWYYDWGLSEAVQVKSRSLVPGSFRYVDTVARESNMPGVVDWEKGDYMEWTVRVAFWVDQRYASLMNFRADIDTQTVDIKYSLWRRPDVPAGKEYVARSIAEKDKYRRQFGIWDYIVHNFQDAASGLIGAELFLSRFNPQLPIDYYLVDVPLEFRDPTAPNGDMYASVAKEANKVFEKAGVPARLAFHEQHAGGIIREFGDIRYNFVVWHNNAFSDIPWLGYGPSWIDPRTGETVNATLNFNNWQGLRWYTFVARDFLEQVSDAFEEGPGPCTPGEVRPVIDEKVKKELRNTTLFAKMTSSMGAPPEEWVLQHDDEWYDYYHMLLKDLRFFYPPYSTFVYSDRESVMAGMAGRREALMAQEREFHEIASRLDSVVSPTGYDDFTSPGAIEAGVDFLRRAKESMQGHAEYLADRRLAAGLRGICLMDGPTMLSTVPNINQRCTAAGTWQTFEEWDADIRWRLAHQTSVHELGHNLGQYHNFYASVDHKHYQPCTGCSTNQKGASSSVMDYVHHFVEAAADLGYYPYDVATLIYAYRYNSQEAVDQETDPEIIRIVHPEWHDPALDPADEPGGPDGATHPERAYLYANDYQEPLSPLVKTFDLGTTPSEMVFNAIQYYDWMYKFRNFRSYRTYWETWNYDYAAFDATYPLRRFLDLWALDWSSSDIENDLRILGVEGDPFFFANLTDEFAAEMGQANRMVVNFFQAILTQSNAERSYSTTYDSYFGDITRIGIIYDKFYAMMSFLGLWPADMYNQDLYAYLAYYEGSWGSDQCYSDALNAVDSMLGGSYDVYPWFLPTAVLLYAQDTHNINFGDQAKKEWIGFRAFDRAQDLIDYFGFDPRTQCMIGGEIVENCPVAALGAEADGHQTFYDQQGGKWAYLFLDDRNQHLAASADQSPISYKMLWDLNEDVNISHSGSADTYSIKYFLDYYNYFN